MVNIGKRMRKLKPLLDIRCGPGAQLLPRPLPPGSLEPPQHPILTRLHLNVPVLAFRNSHHSSRYFWRNHLRQLKYHNPGLPITVGREPYKAGVAGGATANRVTDESGAPEDSSPPASFHEYKSFLQLTFAGSEEQLQSLDDAKDEEIFDWARRRREAYEMNKSSRGGPRRMRQKPENAPAEPTEDEREALARQQSPNWRDAPGREGTPTASTPAQGEEAEETSEAEEPRSRPSLTPPSEPASAPTTSSNPLPPSDHPFPSPILPLPPSSPSPLYTHHRTLTLNTEFRTTEAIWHSLACRAHPTPVPAAAGDEALRRDVHDWEARAAVDRALVKAMVDERRRNDAMLRRARGEVEKLRAEA